MESENKAEKSLLEKKAEMTVDERSKTLEQQMKSYFDNHLGKLLIASTGPQDRSLELGREICALKLLNNQL